MRLRLLTLTLFVLISPGCGGPAAIVAAIKALEGGGGGGAAGPSGTVLAGVAVKGPIQGGTVEAFAADAAGLKTGAALARAGTRADGSFELVLPLGYTGPVLVEVTGGSYVDEASGAAVLLRASDALCLLLADPSDAGGVPVAVTPLTTLATELARTNAGAQGLASAARNAQATVAALFGLSDIVKTRPLDILNDEIPAVTEASKYGVMLAGLAQQAQDIAAAENAEVRPSNLIAALARDLSDGTLNGQDSSGAVQIEGTTRALGATAATADLAAALDKFASVTYTQRKTEQGKPGAVLPAGLSGTELGQAARLLPTAPPPNVTSIQPDTIPVGLGSTVTISGENFSSTGTVMVIFGLGNEALDVTVLSSTSLRCRVPAYLPPGSYDVSVLNIPGSGPSLFGALPKALTVAPPATAPSPGPAAEFLVKTQHGGTERTDTPFTLTITARDGAGRTATGFTGLKQVAFTSTATAAPDGGQPTIPASMFLEFFAGVAVSFSDQTFQLLDASRTPTITASIAQGPSGTTAPITVQHDKLDRFEVHTEHKESETDTVPFFVTLIARDVDGYVATHYAGSRTIAFNSTATTGRDGVSPVVPASQSIDFVAGMGTSAAGSFKLVNGLERPAITATDSAAGIVGTTAAIIVIDTTPPATPPMPDLAAASDSGLSDTDNYTNDTTPTLNGTAEPGSTVEIFDGATSLATVTADLSTGAWTYTRAPPLADGDHPITVKAKDASNNVLSASPPLTLTIDTAPPSAAPANLTAPNGAGTIQLSWTAVPDAASYKIYYDNDQSGAPYQGADAAQGASPVSVGKVTSFALTGLVKVRPYYVVVSAVDLAGNEGRSSETSLFHMSRGGDGTFRAKVDYENGGSPQAQAVSTGDFNADGVLDLVVANPNSDFVSVLLGNGPGARGEGTFAAKVDYGTGGNPHSVATGDFDSDGILDMVAANYSSSTVSVLLGQGELVR